MGVKFKKTPGLKESRELAASNWVKNTCRDIQTAVIKTCAYNNRYALKCAFGEEYNELYPGTIYSPPSSVFFINGRLITSIYLIGNFCYRNYRHIL